MNIELMSEPEALSQLDFPVVAIGASAGGLEAVTQMFRSVEPGTGMAFVLVMHLDPNHESMMAELLASKTGLEVRQIKDNDHIEVDCLHVIPPGSSLRIENGRFKLDPFSEPRGLRRPIDSFFRSLAQVQADKAACVVLSGTGADGTAGLRSIKEFGGVSAVQSPEEARYDGMPVSAIATELADFVLEAERIVVRIKAFFDGAMQSNFPEDGAQSEQTMQRIFAILRDKIGMDFAGYKRSTLLRRLRRRMHVLEVESTDDYLAELSKDNGERESLARDFLINVTSFFRDAENFELVRKHVLLPLLTKVAPSREVRIWVPGCSSGQEAYTIAMLVAETCQELEIHPLVQIFATDVDEAMIEIAREGTYPVSMYSEIPPAYRDKYTVASDERFEPSQEIKRMVRFSVHNIIQNPPFSRIDFISCRNLLIYLGEQLQSELFPLLHFSLRPGGMLFLGTSESVTRSSELFIAADQKARIFRRNDAAKRVHVNLPLGKSARDGIAQRGIGRLPREIDPPSYRSFDASNAAIFENYAPPFVRVTRDGQIIDSSGDLSLFIMSRPSEEQSLNVLARDALADLLVPLATDAINTGDRRSIKDIEVTSQFGTQKADIIAHPMNDGTAAVIFLAKDRLQPVIDSLATQTVSRDRRISDLRDDLQATRLELKAKVEEIETANEELKSSNEEMMSMNEELQSANEELTTANEELKNKIDELTLANSDLDNFLQSADLAMIVLDREGRIRHITNAARSIMPLQQSDEGRLLSEFNIPVNGLAVDQEVRHVIETGVAFSSTSEVNEDGKSFFLRITPYFFRSGAIEGASVTLLDITDEATLHSTLASESRKLRLAMAAAGMGFWESDPETGEMTVDKSGAELVGLANAGVMTGEAFFQNMAADDVKKSIAIHDEGLAEGEPFDFTARINHPEKGPRWIRVHITPQIGEKGKRKDIGLGIDVTEVMTLQQDVVEQSAKLKLAMEAARMGFAQLHLSKNTVTVDPELAQQLGLEADGEMTIEEMTSNFVSDDIALMQRNLDRAVANGEEYEFDFRIEDPTGGMRWIRTRGLPFEAATGETLVIGPTVDITAIKQQQLLLEEMSHRIKNLFAVVGGLIQAAPKEHEETERMAHDLLERVVSLGRVYDLARKDASKLGVPLDQLLKSVVQPHTTAQDVNISGPMIFVDGDTVNTLTLIIHELATNAAKYGGLSSTKGKVAIHWKIKGKRRVLLNWKEKAPGFKAPDEDQGFGGILIDSGMRQLKGCFTRSYTREGANIDIEFQL
ncbi:MAG: CheR family methyltransferase [Pseudomonadota bacterium]